MMNNQKYTKNTGGPGIHGGDYQIKLLSLFLLEAFEREGEFRLSTENTDGGKFDDVVLETDKMTILVQAKHKEDPKDKRSFITFDDIVNAKKDEFCLYKYLKCIPKVKNKFTAITALILCTNTTVTKDKKDKIKTYISSEEMEDDHIFYFSDKKFYYTFNENSKELLPKDKTPDITDDIIDLFLEKMQLVSIDDSNIDKRIEFLIREIDIFDAIVDTRQAVMVLKEYIKNWLEDKNGNYIIPQHVGAFRSLHFINELKQLDIEFNTAHQEISNLNKYTCFTIKNRDITKLHLFKIYKQLKTEKVLIVNSNETTSRKEDIISAFIINEFVYLVIPLFDGEYHSLKTVINNVAKETFEREYKKIIFVVEKVEMSEELSRELKHFVDVRENIIEFETFSEKYQNEISSRTICFQGKEIQFKDILPRYTLNTILEESILLKLINKEKITINERYQESNINFYVSRSVYYTSSKFASVEEDQNTPASTKTNVEEVLSEEDICNIICNDNNAKTILLTNGPGMGKTTTLSNLQKLLNSKFNFWITKINLNDYTKIYKNSFTKTSADLLSSLTFDQNSKLLDFEKGLFNLPGNVILMLDAVDEVHRIYSDLISKLIKYCESLDNVRSIIVTSRPYCVSSIIEATTNAVVFSLKPFSRDAQIQYLYRYWTVKFTPNEKDLPNYKTFAEKLMEKLERTIDKTTSLLEVPLHTQMIADIFESDCQTYVVSNNFVPESINKLKITDLYAMFIKKKKSIYVYEKCKGDSNTEVEYILTKEFDRAMEEHTIKALLLIFDDTQYNYFKILRDPKMEELSLNSRLTMGILEESDGVVKFIHRTFAEYLAAKHVCDCLFESVIEVDFLHFYITELSLGWRYDMLKMFIRSILDFQKLPTEVLAVFAQIGLKLDWLKETKYVAALYRDWSVLMITLRSIDVCTGNIGVVMKEQHDTVNSNNKQQDLLSCIFSDYNVFRVLMLTSSDIIKIDKNGLNVLHIYVRQDGKYVLDYFERYAYTLPFVYTILSNNLNGLHIMITHTVEEINDEQVINKIWEKRGIDINNADNSGMTALHFAVENNMSAAKLLLDLGADTEIKNFEGATPLLVAYKRHAFNCAIYLIENKADITAVDNEGYGFYRYVLVTLRDIRMLGVNYKEIMDNILQKNCPDTDIYNELRIALNYDVEKNYFSQTRLLLNPNIVKDTKQEEESPLLVACLYNLYDCATNLLEKGSDITALDREGRNVLHCLLSWYQFHWSEAHNEELMKNILKKNRIDVDGIDKRGMTALHYAVETDNVAAAILLLNAGANLEMKNTGNETPLNAACRKKAFKCLLHFINNGVDVCAIDNEGCTILHRLLQGYRIDWSKSEHEQILNTILKRKCIDINSADNNGKTALHYAVENNYVSVTKLLVSAGASTETKNKDGETPLLVACDRRSLECATELIDNGADITVVDAKGRNILQCLIDEKGLPESSYESFIKNILKHNRIDVNSVCTRGRTVLHYCVKHNFLVLIQTLVAAGADKEVKDNTGKTPLLLSLVHGASACSSWLINEGADITTVDNEGRNVLYYLLKVFRRISEQIDCQLTVKTILENNRISLDSAFENGMTALHYAVVFALLPMTELLVTAGADLEIKNDKEETPLLSACLVKSLDCAIYLIDKGADIAVTDSKGRNILHYFFGRDMNKTPNSLDCHTRNKVLKRISVDLNCTDNDGMTVLHYAVQNNYDSEFEIILAAGVDIEIKNNQGATPVLLASLCNSFKCAHYLIDSGAVISHVDNDGRTILHCLLKGYQNSGSESYIQKILEKILARNQVDINCVDNDGMTALHYSIETDNILATKLLLSAGANVEIKNVDDETPLLLACRKNSRNCLIHLIENGADVTPTNKEGRNVLHCLLSRR